MSTPEPPDHSMFADFHLPPVAREWFHRGYAMQTNGDFEGAIDCYRRSIADYPSAEAYTFLGWVHSLSGRLLEAIDECHTAIRLDPDFGNPYNDIGAYLFQLGRLDSAIPWLEKATHAVRYANREYPHTNLARIYDAKGMWHEATEQFRAALAIKPDYEPAREALSHLQACLN